jgi:hypothetical protein
LTATSSGPTARLARLAGHLQLAAIPAACHALSRQPSNVRLTASKTSIEVLRMWTDNLSGRCGLTYVDDEPLGNVNTIAPFYEKYPPHMTQLADEFDVHPIRSPQAATR